jgi:hypothetical protein
LEPGTAPRIINNTGFVNAHDVQVLRVS